MITAKEAYDKVKKQYSKVNPDSCYDYGDFYSFSDAKEGDMGGNDWKVDKETGKVSAFEFLEYLEITKTVNPKAVKI